MYAEKCIIFIDFLIIAFTLNAFSSSAFSIPVIKEDLVRKEFEVSAKPRSFSDFGEKIVSGHEAPPHKFPWTAYLRVFSEQVKGYCGGSLVSDRHVLTAAHCVFRLKARDVRVELGRHRLSKRGKGVVRARSGRVDLHPLFDRVSWDYDVAVITLVNPVNFTARIRPVCLPERAIAGEEEDYANRTLTIVGWGRLYEEGPSSNVLMKAEVKGWDNVDCQEVMTLNISSRMLCAGGEETDACQGDSGGPLLMLNERGYVLVGITSFGIGCGRRNMPGVYARVDRLMDFIYAVMNDTEVNTCDFH